MRPDFDCIVVGAGLAGALLATALGREGFTTAVLDRRQPLRAVDDANADVRGLALAPSSRGFVAQLGLWEALAGAATAIERIHVSDRGHFGRVVLDAAEFGLDALGHVVRADRLLQTVEQALLEVPSCQVFWGTSVGSVVAAGDHVTVAGTHGSTATTLTGRLAIAADGADSRLRAACGIEGDVRDYDQTAIVCNVSVARPQAGTAFERFTEDGPLALLPLGGSRYVAVRCCRGEDVESLLALDDDGICADFEARFGSRMGAFSTPGPRRDYPLALNVARTLVAERCILAGAAATTVHPNAAQGLNLGLRDAAGLLAVLSEARASAEDIGSAQVLERYASRRRPDRRRVVKLTDGLARLFASRLTPVRALRGAALTGLGLCPPARRRLVQRAAGY